MQSSAASVCIAAAALTSRVSGLYRTAASPYTKTNVVERQDRADRVDRTQVKIERKDPGCSPAAKAEATNQASRDSHTRFISFSPVEPSEHVDVGLTPLSDIGGEPQHRGLPTKVLIRSHLGSCSIFMHAAGKMKRSPSPPVVERPGSEPLAPLDHDTGWASRRSRAGLARGAC